MVFMGKKSENTEQKESLERKDRKKTTIGLRNNKSGSNDFVFCYNL
jgi:hypothetical protein